jgi:hypothetical protein
MHVMEFLIKKLLLSAISVRLEAVVAMEEKFFFLHLGESRQIIIDIF